MAEREVSLLRCALRIAADGMPVFPLRPHTKVPAIERWQQHACTDPDTIRAWWTRSAFNIGIATGIQAESWSSTWTRRRHRVNPTGDNRSQRSLEIAVRRSPATLERLSHQAAGSTSTSACHPRSICATPLDISAGMSTPAAPGATSSAPARSSTAAATD